MSSRGRSAPARLIRWLNDRILIGLVRWTLRVFFRRIEVVGAERIPRGKPVLLVANHFNGLIDPLLLAFLPLRPRFLAKSTLWSHPVVRPLLAMSSAVPVYRRQDGADMTRNAESFDECHRRLAEGETVALFPEGRSHNEPSLAPMKTGAARIVLEAMAKHPGLDVLIVPVGLNFEDKETFRSRVLIEVGAPIDPATECARHAADPRGAVRTLTERIGAGLAAVTLNHASHAEARLVERTAELYLRREPGSEPPTLAATFAARRAIAAGYERMRYRERLALEAYRTALDQYERILTSLVLEDRHVVEPGSARPFLKAAFVMLLAPVALLGLLLNWLPYHLAGRIARRVEESPDLPATYKLFSGFVLLPSCWLLAAALTWWLAGPPLAAGVLLLGPLAGYAALRFSERIAACWTDIRAHVLLRAHDGLLAVLRSEREAAETHLEQLVAAYDASVALIGTAGAAR